MSGLKTKRWKSAGNLSRDRGNHYMYALCSRIIPYKIPQMLRQANIFPTEHNETIMYPRDQTNV